MLCYVCAPILAQDMAVPPTMLPPSVHDSDDEEYAGWWDRDLNAEATGGSCASARYAESAADPRRSRAWVIRSVAR